MEKKPLISVVSPIYYGEKMLSELVQRCVQTLVQITENFEIILVNDASPDNSWSEIVKVCQQDSRVKGLNLSKNFGQHPAISAGLQYAQGEWVVVMDCDLQDRPEEIINLYKKAQEGYDIVYARRANRQDGYLKRLSSKLFHSIYDWLSGFKTDEAIGNFGIYHKKVISATKSITERNKTFGILIGFVGFRSTAIDVQHSERAEGSSSYTFRKLLRLAFDNIISNTNKPLKLAVQLGFLMAFISFLLALYNVIAKLLGIIQLAGYTTTIFSVWFVGGLILFVMGILGLYIGKIFDQLKGKPIFIVADKLNVDE